MPVRARLEGASWLVPVLGVGLLLLAANLAFWQLRILGTGTETDLAKAWGHQTVDLYTEHYPMVRHGFEALAAGRLPLWNPYQLAGLPFLAVPHTGLLYPGNLAYLAAPADLATELTLLAHLLFAGVCTWLLARSLGFDTLAGLAAAVTFSWSGWMVFYVHQSALISAMCWLPATVLLVERATRGSRAAALALALSVAFQLLNGATEIVALNAYVAVPYALFRLGSLVRAGSAPVALQRAAWLTAAGAVGVALAAVQLLPSLELVQQSMRTAGSLSLASRIPMWGVADASVYATGFFGASGRYSVGLLPLLGIAFGWRVREQRGLWMLLVAIALVSALITFGGLAAEIYFSSPIGSLFRIPMKFYHPHAFAQALLAAFAVAQLRAWCGTARQELWQGGAWWAGIIGVSGALAWLASHGVRALPLALLGGVVVFGAARSSRARSGVLVALVALHAGSLFFGASTDGVRPWARPGVYDRQAALLEDLVVRAGSDRVYLSPELRMLPEMTHKQGMLRSLRVSVDYEALVLARYGDYFKRTSGARSWPPPLTPPNAFHGFYSLGVGSGWRLMDLTSTRFYAVRRGDAVDEFLDGAVVTPGIWRMRRVVDGPIRVYERTGYAPRAYYVPRARVFAEPEALLSALLDPGFDFRREVLVEADAPLERGSRGATGRAWLRVDEPERVDVEVRAGAPGFLVLSDLHYPGWVAHVDGRPLPIHRANYLYRAVPVERGVSTVEFRYRPASFRWGAIVSGVSALGVSLLGAALLLRRRALEAAPQLPPSA